MSDSLPPSALAAIRAALAAGNKIEAVKLMREATGLGLAESKAAVERLESHGDASVLPAQAPVQTGILPPGVGEALAAGNKIEAIRLYREATRVGLKEAKDAVEAIDRQRLGLPTNAPMKSGCLGLLLACAIPAAMLAFWLY